MKLLLTGATGFVGRNILLRSLWENRYDEIIVPVRSLEKLEANCVADGFAGIPSRVRPVVGEAPDWKLDLAGIDHGIHCAGVLFAGDWDAYHRVNVKGTESLFEQLGQIKKMVVLSSMAAGGPCNAKTPVKGETDEDAPVTLYGKSKLEMEGILREKFSRVPYLVLRPPMVLGPRDQATLPLFQMVSRPVHFKPGFRPKFYSYISVLDLTSAVFAALDGEWGQTGQTYYVGSEEPVTDEQLIGLTAQACERKGMLVKVPHGVLKVVSRMVDSVPPWRRAVPSLTVDRAREIWPDRWVVSSQAFRSAFDWKPTEPLLDALKKTRKWYVDSGQLRG